MSITIQWLGHSAFALQIEGHSLLFDPFLSGNPLAAVSPDALSPQWILLSHAHGDHLGDTVSIAQRSGATVITNNEIGDYLSEQGLTAVHPMNPGGSIDLGVIRVTCTRAEHSSSFGDGRYGGVPMGFVVTVKSSGKRLYFAGDTALFGDMALIGEDGLEAAFLPIGDYFTMGIADAVKATKLLNPRVVIPMHYNTFPPIVQNAAEWAQRVNMHTNAQPIVLDPGNTYTLE